MSTTPQKLNQLEQDAANLVTELANLKKEVGSYKDAANELSASRTTLENFIGRTDKLLEQTHSILATIKEVGASEIFSSLEELKQSSDGIKKLLEDISANASISNRDTRERIHNNKKLLYVILCLVSMGVIGVVYQIVIPILP